MIKYAFFQGFLIGISDINLNDPKIMHLTPKHWKEIQNMLTDQDAYNTIILLNKFNSKLLVYEYKSKRLKKHPN